MVVISCVFRCAAVIGGDVLIAPSGVSKNVWFICAVLLFMGLTACAVLLIVKFAKLLSRNKRKDK